MVRVFKALTHYKLALLVVIVTVFGGVYGNLNLPNYMSQIIDRGIADKDTAFIFQTGLIMLGFTLVAVVCNLLTGYFSARIAVGVGRDFRNDVFTKVEGFSQSEMNQFSTASLITRTNNDILQLQMFVMMFLRIVLMAPVMCIGGLTLAFAKSPEMSRVLFFAMPLLIIIVVFIAKKAMPYSKSMQKKLDRLNLVMREKLTGIRVIRAFGTEEYERQRFENANQDLTQTTIKMQRLMSLLMPVAMLILNATTVALVWFGSSAVPSGHIQVGDIIAVIQYVMQIMMSVMMLSMIFVMYPRAAASAERIGEVLDTAPQINDRPDTKDNTALKGYVEFRDVTFRYPDAEEAALRHISFSAKPGETTAIIGSTGSGKSALVNLIPRFYDIESGQILIDGVDVRDYSQKVLRRKIGYVPQKALLFTGTIADNIRFGDDSITDEDIRKAAKIAQAADFIAEKESGFESPITQGGGNVSGGQRQRLSIARAIARRPEIYIFDDSFSALDFKTDAALRQALAAETQEATVIIVAQRVSTIMQADRILVLENGQVMGLGSHSQLLETCETYREIVHSQLSDEEVGL